MIGEALKQLTSATDYMFRHVHFRTGLILHEGQDTEIITEMQKLQLTTTTESEWYSFSIASRNGSQWVKHCYGQARPGMRVPKHSRPIGTQPRVVSCGTWYSAMRRFGFDYGAKFRCMHDISAHPIQKIAVATIMDIHPQEESPWVMHPTILDSVLQIFSVAAYHGLPRNFPYTSVPSYIEELQIKAAAGPITLKVQADEVPTKGSISGNLIGVADGETIIDLRGVVLSRIGESEEESDQDPHAAVELEWKPDINLLDPSYTARRLSRRHTACWTNSHFCACSRRMRAFQTQAQILFIYKNTKLG